MCKKDRSSPPTSAYTHTRVSPNRPALLWLKEEALSCAFCFAWPLAAQVSDLCENAPRIKLELNVCTRTERTARVFFHSKAQRRCRAANRGDEWCVEESDEEVRTKADTRHNATPIEFGRQPEREKSKTQSEHHRHRQAWEDFILFGGARTMWIHMCRAQSWRITNECVNCLLLATLVACSECGRRRRGSLCSILLRRVVPGAAASMIR